MSSHNHSYILYSFLVYYHIFTGTGISILPASLSLKKALCQFLSCSHTLILPPSIDTNFIKGSTVCSNIAPAQSTSQNPGTTNSYFICIHNTPNSKNKHLLKFFSFFPSIHFPWYYLTMFDLSNFILFLLSLYFRSPALSVLYTITKYTPILYGYILYLQHIDSYF